MIRLRWSGMRVCVEVGRTNAALSSRAWCCRGLTLQTCGGMPSRLVRRICRPCSRFLGRRSCNAYTCCALIKHQFCTLHHTALFCECRVSLCNKHPFLHPWFEGRVKCVCSRFSGCLRGHPSAPHWCRPGHSRLAAPLAQARGGFCAAAPARGRDPG